MSFIMGYMCHNPHQRTVSVLLAADSPAHSLLCQIIMISICSGDVGHIFQKYSAYKCVLLPVSTCRSV